MQWLLICSACQVYGLQIHVFLYPCIFIQIFLVSWLHVVDCVPPCLFMYAITVELSDMILKCLTRTLHDKNDFMASFIAKSSKQLMFNVFSGSDHPPLTV